MLCTGSIGSTGLSVKEMVIEWRTGFMDDGVENRGIYGVWA